MGDSRGERTRITLRSRSRPVGKDCVAGLDHNLPVDLVLVNAPLRDYAQRPRTNDYTLPVLGMAYIATYCKQRGFNVGVLDAEALGVTPEESALAVNAARPRWVGFNLLAPTYPMAAAIAKQLSKEVKVMVGGHQARALPTEITADPSFPRIDALVVGEGEVRVAKLLEEADSRKELPLLWWRDPFRGDVIASTAAHSREFLSPHIDDLPFIDRRFLVQDPFLANDGRIEANLVGARGCPYDCSFCGAAVSANPDIKIRTRTPENILAEMRQLQSEFGVSAFRFVDDLFLGHPGFIKRCSRRFRAEHVGEDFVWDATGRINVLNKLDDLLLEELATNGCREVALGIESGSPRMLDYLDKRITPEMSLDVARRLLRFGIAVKGYFILGLPGETRSELEATIRLVHQLWDLSDQSRGSFRASVFEFRPYPGTGEWTRLLQTGRYTPQELSNYQAIDLTSQGTDEVMRSRDEFNFSVNIQFGEVAPDLIRSHIVELMHEQGRRLAA